MLAKKNAHVWLAFVGIVVGFTMMNLVVAHNNDPTKLAILIAGASLCVLAPLTALMWSFKRKRRLDRDCSAREAQSRVPIETEARMQPQNKQTMAREADPNPYDPPRNNA